MPYPNEFATGESLPGFTSSRGVLEFQGAININDVNERHELPDTVAPIRGHDRISRVIAIDGSTVRSSVRNGYPGAEAALMRIAAVVLDLAAIKNPNPEWIPSPSEIREMEQCDAVDAVLPGCNITQRNCPTDSPTRYFRRTVYQTLQGAIERNHESLLDTLTAITACRKPSEIDCPVEDCDLKVTPQAGEASCQCSRRETIYQTDSLRIHERFDEYGSNGQAYTAIQQVTEQLALVNILRYCEQAGNPDFIRDTAFVLDGPLAIFGMPAWLKYWIQNEIKRIHNKCCSDRNPGIMLSGIEKSGQFLEHLKQLDWSDIDGPGQVIPVSTASAPSLRYIHRHIIRRPSDSKSYGSATYYGRKILYKNRSGQHSVITIPIVNAEGEDGNCTNESAFPRLGEILDMMDELSTYLYEDGFAPLVRAHAHAAIPLKAGAEILSKLFPRS